MPLCS